jgi:hypothetical protein
MRVHTPNHPSASRASPREVFIFRGLPEIGACGGLVCVRIHLTDPASRADLRSDAEMVPHAGRRKRRASAYRDGELICERVDLLIRPDTRIGLAPRERRVLAARFVDRLAPAFRNELEQLVRRRGAAATRIGDRIETIELVVDDPGGRQVVVGRLEPPQSRRWKLSENEFVIREHL